MVERIRVKIKYIYAYRIRFRTEFSFIKEIQIGLKYDDNIKISNKKLTEINNLIGDDENLSLVCFVSVDYNASTKEKVIMLYIILGIIVVILLATIIIKIINIAEAIIEFVQNHIALSICICILVGIVISIVKSKNPIGFLSVWRYKILLFLWNITYKNVLFDFMILFLIMIPVIYILSKGLEVISLQFHKYRIVSIILFITSIIISASIVNFNEVSASDISIMAMMVMSLIVFICVILCNNKILRNIGRPKAVLKYIDFISIGILALWIIIIFNAINFPVSWANNCFSVNIERGIIYWIYWLSTTIFLAFSYYKVINGYSAIKKYIKSNGIFTYDDILNIDQTKALFHCEEYVSNVINKMIARGICFEIGIGKNTYMNNDFYKYFGKSIKANKTSDQIMEGAKYSINKYNFNTLYTIMFHIFKGYSIDFAENEELACKKRQCGDISETEFILMRYPIENHPIKLETDEIKQRYICALGYFMENSNIDMSLWKAKVDEYCKEFNIDTLSIKYISSEEAIQTFVKKIKRKTGLLKSVGNDYRYLIILEALYFKNLLDSSKLSYKDIENYCRLLEINASSRDVIYQYINHMYLNRELDKAQKLINSCFKKEVLNNLLYVHHNLLWNERYIMLPQYHVAVCATMSSGKSTFINALLGSDYIPAKNEACTAKITTIRDNDNLSKIVGYYVRNDGSKVYSNTIDGDVLMQWNQDENVSETILEGNIDEVECGSGILVIHDTPGTNNSEDISHHNKTISFIENIPINLVVFLINAEHISTIDSEILLKEVKERTIDKHNSKIIFLLNKVDSFDDESGEDVEQIITDIDEQLKSYGFDTPIIFPVSSNAARLFKLVLNGKELTKKEERNFKNLFEQFSNESMNMSQKGTVRIELQENQKYAVTSKDEKILVDNTEYSRNKIINALNNTGIAAIETWLNNTVNK